MTQLFITINYKIIFIIIINSNKYCFIVIINNKTTFITIHYCETIIII